MINKVDLDTRHFSSLMVSTLPISQSQCPGGIFDVDASRPSFQSEKKRVNRADSKVMSRNHGENCWLTPRGKPGWGLIVEGNRRFPNFFSLKKNTTEYWPPESAVPGMELCNHSSKLLLYAGYCNSRCETTLNLKRILDDGAVKNLRDIFLNEPDQEPRSRVYTILNAQWIFGYTSMV